MRNATPEEVQAHRQWFVEVSFVKLASPASKPLKKLGPFVGVSQQQAEEMALKHSIERWKEGVAHTVADSYDELVYDNIIFWDWKEAKAVGGDAFFKKLDAQLKPHKEVVHIPFDGDAYPWFIGEPK